MRSDRTDNGCFVRVFHSNYTVLHIDPLATATTGTPVHCRTVDGALRIPTIVTAENDRDRFREIKSKKEQYEEKRLGNGVSAES